MPRPTEQNRLLVIGLIGGVASGKSTVGKMLAEWSGTVLNADQFAHELLATSEIQLQLQEAFGDTIVASGNVNKALLAELVFGDTHSSMKQRKRLESILHPPIRCRTLSEIEQSRRQGNMQFVVVDAPLLLEASFDDFCDEVWFIDTPIDLRQKWAEQRGWTADEITRRETHQLSLAQKRQRADRIIRNNGDLTDLRAQIKSALSDCLKNHN